MAKRNLRAALSAARRAMPPVEREEQDTRVRAALCAWLDQRAPGTVVGYAPMAGEPGGPALPADLARHVPRVLLPVLRDDLDLDWAVYDGTLVPASRGLVEPAGTRLGPEAIARADVVIVPGLAAGRDGVRLGRGGGSYDRALARVRRPALVIVALYDDELIDCVPAECHDRPVDGVVRPGTGVTIFQDVT